jgi:osmotically-inducible protein OsmY
MLSNRGALLTGLGMGVGLMYFLDPARGRRRRALVRDQMTHAARISSEAAGAAGRDLAHRTSGTAARLRRRFRHERVDDDVLVERVRARLGRAVSHSHAVRVGADRGVVTLRGPILQHEIGPLLKAVEAVSGVREVVDRLEPHAGPDVPALQGGGRPSERQPNILRRSWSPTTRAMAAGSGLAIAAYGAVLANAARKADAS